MPPRALLTDFQIKSIFQDEAEVPFLDEDYAIGKLVYGLGFETLYTFLFADTDENNEVSLPEFSSLIKLLLEMDRESLNFFAMKEESEQMTSARGFAIVDHNRDEKLSFAEVQMFVQGVFRIYKESWDQYSDFLLRILFLIADSDESHKLSSQEFFSLNNYINKNELSLIIGSLDPIQLDPWLFDDADC